MLYPLPPKKDKLGKCENPPLPMLPACGKKKLSFLYLLYQGYEYPRTGICLSIQHLWGYHGISSSAEALLS